MKDFQKDRKMLAIAAAEKAHEAYLKQPKTFVALEGLQAPRMKNFMAREAIRRTMPRIINDLQPLERMVGPTLDYRDSPPNELARKRGRPVARLHEIVDGVEPSGFGTGFMIAPNVLITNNHVFPDPEYANNCGANFLHEKDANGNVLKGITFRLDPARFFFTNHDLDFSLVYVHNEPLEPTNSLNDIGFLNLISTPGKIIVGSPLSIIEYPLGNYKRYAYEENRVTQIDDNEGIILYTTDTQQGSSGSPGFNDAWEVVALHYTGVPSIVDGKWRTKSGAVWDKNTMSDDDVLWIANAGKSISKIVGFLNSLKNLSASDKGFIDSILKLSNDPLKESATNGPRPEPQPSNSSKQEMHMNTSDKIVLNFTGPNTIYINSQPGGAVVKSPEMAESFVQQESKMRFDEDYGNRKGYDEDFLDGFTVPMPTVIAKRQKELYTAFGASRPYLAKYHHYSLVMNKARRMLMWSASNANYSASVRDKRDRSELGADGWRLDKRIPAKYQIQAEEFYDPATKVDKGHIVRRDDNCWADKANALGIEYANADTFHWTNCTPQHEDFNRDMFGVHGLWGVLENEIKKQLDNANDPNKDYGQKACILAGPVLDNNDPEYNNIQYPETFWKVFAINSESNGKLVYGFLLSQKQVIDDSGLEALPRFNATVKALQASLADIEKATGVVFDASLHKYDVLAGAASPTEALRGDMSNFVSKKSKKTK